VEYKVKLHLLPEVNYVSHCTSSPKIHAVSTILSEGRVYRIWIRSVKKYGKYEYKVTYAVKQTVAVNNDYVHSTTVR